MIYLDNAATTKPFAEVAESALDSYNDNFFNPSALYRGGIAVKNSINSAKSEILKFFPSGYELVFTSGGTEADNLAIFSSARRGNAVTTLGEHSAVYESFKELKNRGIETRFAALNKVGGVDEENLLSLIDDKTAFVSIVHVNNETGAVNDINGLAAKIKKINPNVLFHSDGVQAFCKLDCKISDAIDYYSVSAHKINALKGTGALIKKKSAKLSPLIFGGGQENGLRSGTENVFGITAFANAAAVHKARLSENVLKFKDLKEKFLGRLNADVFKIISDENCAPHIVSLSAVGLKSEVLQHMLEDFGIIVGTGSACSSRVGHSRILSACGYGANVLSGLLRISFSADNTSDEVLEAADKLNYCALKLAGVMKK